MIEAPYMTLAVSVVLMGMAYVYEIRQIRKERKLSAKPIENELKANPPRSVQLKRFPLFQLTAPLAIISIVTELHLRQIVTKSSEVAFFGTAMLSYLAYNLYQTLKLQKQTLQTGTPVPAEILGIRHYHRSTSRIQIKYPSQGKVCEKWIHTDCFYIPHQVGDTVTVIVPQDPSQSPILYSTSYFKVA